MAITYEQAKKDHATLWDIGPADDMTGGYVDQEDLNRLLASPTKKTARNCFISQIVYWFQSGTETRCFGAREISKPSDIKLDHPEIIEIAERYNCEDRL